MMKEVNRRMDGNGRQRELELRISVGSNIEGNTICALGEAAAWPVKWAVKKFRKDFEAKIKDITIGLPVLNKVHGLQMSDEYDTITFESEQVVVEDLMGKVQELVNHDQAKRSS